MSCCRGRLADPNNRSFISTSTFSTVASIATAFAPSTFPENLVYLFGLIIAKIIVCSVVHVQHVTTAKVTILNRECLTSQRLLLHECLYSNDRCPSLLIQTHATTMASFPRFASKKAAESPPHDVCLLPTHLYSIAWEWLDHNQSLHGYRPQRL